MKEHSECFKQSLNNVMSHCSGITYTYENRSVNCTDKFKDTQVARWFIQQTLARDSVFAIVLGVFRV